MRISYGARRHPNRSKMENPMIEYDPLAFPIVARPHRPAKNRAPKALWDRRGSRDRLSLTHCVMPLVPRGRCGVKASLILENTRKAARVPHPRTDLTRISQRQGRLLRGAKRRCFGRWVTDCGGRMAARARCGDYGGILLAGHPPEAEGFRTRVDPCVPRATGIYRSAVILLRYTGT